MPDRELRASDFQNRGVRRRRNRPADTACHCGQCPRCLDEARWERIFQELRSRLFASSPREILEISGREAWPLRRALRATLRRMKALAVHSVPPAAGGVQAVAARYADRSR